MSWIFLILVFAIGLVGGALHAPSHWTLILICIALSGPVHLMEERIASFTRFFNTRVLHSTDEWHPVGPAESFWKDFIGLGVAILALCALGFDHPAFGWAAIGFIAADAIQHLTYSVAWRSYTPGIATAVLFYIPLVVLAARQIEGNHAEYWALAGGAFIPLNIIGAAIRK